jgi:hypothetical protein
MRVRKRNRILAVLAVALTAGGAPAASYGASALRSAAVRVVASGACRTQRPPGLATDDAAPGAQLRSILSIARRPATGPGLSGVGSFDPATPPVLSVFARYIRIVKGERGTRLAFFPALVCGQTQSGPLTSPSTIVRVRPEQAMVMVVLSNPQPHPDVLVGTAATIRSGPALPGLDLPKSHGWIQATVVPDGVARVVMHFTPPFLHHYTATATVHDNIGIIVRKPDYTPTTVAWYAADGHLIRRFVNRSEIHLDECLAHHRANC